MSDTQELTAKVEKWLNEQGYPLEYRTYVSFYKKFGFSSGLALRIDGFGDRVHDIDVFARLSEVDPPHSKILTVLCECKYAEKPWVLLYGNQDKSSMLMFEWFNIARSTLLDEFPWPDQIDEDQSTTLENLSKTYLFGGEMFAHNVVEFEGGNRTDGDHAYRAIRQIVSAAKAHVASANKLGLPMLMMAFPCVVMQGRLFAGGFDVKKDRILAREVKYGRVRWREPGFQTNVDIVQISAVDEYVAKVHKSLVRLMDAITRFPPVTKHSSESRG